MQDKSEQAHKLSSKCVEVPMVDPWPSGLRVQAPRHQSLLCLEQRAPELFFARKQKWS